MKRLQQLELPPSYQPNSSSLLKFTPTKITKPLRKNSSMASMMPPERSRRRIHDLESH